MDTTPLQSQQHSNMIALIHSTDEKSLVKEVKEMVAIDLPLEKK
jgi:hypothetical protein